MGIIRRFIVFFLISLVCLVFFLNAINNVALKAVIIALVIALGWSRTREEY